ncbi:MAG: HAMP domain-containing sensor histidine kinase [Clostridia bacterium]
MKKTIKFKIIASFCSMLVLLLISQIIFNTFFSRNFFVNQSENEVLDLFYEIKNSYSDNIEDIYYLIESNGDISGVSVQIFSQNNLIYSSEELFNLMNNNRPVANIDHSFIFEDFSETPTSEFTDNQDALGQSIAVYGKFIYEETEIYVVITRALESIDASMNVFTKSSILISCIILPIGIFLIFKIGESLAKPIKNIENVSDKLAKLDFTDIADENISTFEIANLAKSINSMSSQLEKSMNELQCANIKLQEDIEYQMKIDSSRKQFIANISHEMKTPLALLQIYCENLKNNVDEIDKDEYCTIIIEETQRLNNIVKDMLNVSSIENGLAKVKKENFSISQSLQNVIYTLNPMFSDIELKVNIQENINIHGDKNQIEEAMRNYIINAISHLKENGILEISLIKENNDVVFTVYNQGENITETDLEDIWDSFYKSDKSRTRKFSSNAGLGLYIVKLIIKNHNGKYLVQNKEDGVQFSFKIKVI